MSLLCSNEFVERALPGRAGPAAKMLSLDGTVPVHTEILLVRTILCRFLMWDFTRSSNVRGQHRRRCSV
ncbi:MAG: hypothetical protein ACI8RE_003087, partial [Ilumatobacter sp.]